MNIASRARAGLALAACLAVAAGANAAPIDLGSTATPLGDDHARTTATTSTPVAPTGAVRDDHARTTATTSTPVAPTGAVRDDHARTDSVTIPLPGTISVPVASDRVLTAPVSANSDGFDWSDAGIGFGTAIGFALLAGGTMMLARRPRFPHTPAI